MLKDTTQAEKGMILNLHNSNPRILIPRASQNISKGRKECLLSTADVKLFLTCNVCKVRQACNRDMILVPFAP